MTNNPTDPIQAAIDALKPCPFCGQDVTLDHFPGEGEYGIHHYGCRALMEGFESRKEAIAAWNTRAVPTPTDEDTRNALDSYMERIEYLHDAILRITNLASEKDSLGIHTAAIQKMTDDFRIIKSGVVGEIHRALEQMQGWQTITVKTYDQLKEGEDVLLYEPKSQPRVCAGWWEFAYGDFVWCDSAGNDIDPTHWMPLPAPPKSEGGE